MDSHIVSGSLKSNFQEMKLLHDVKFLHIGTWVVLHSIIMFIPLLHLTFVSLKSYDLLHRAVLKFLDTHLNRLWFNLNL